MASEHTRCSTSLVGGTNESTATPPLPVRSAPCQNDTRQQGPSARRVDLEAPGTAGGGGDADCRLPTAAATMENSTSAPQTLKCGTTRDPATPLLDASPKEVKTGTPTESHTPTLTAATFTTARTRQQLKCPSVANGHRKRGVCARRNVSALERNSALTPHTTDRPRGRDAPRHEPVPEGPTPDASTGTRA